MTDVFDSAQAREALNLEASLAAARGRGDKPEVVPTGKCLYCFEPIKPKAVNQRFCDADCRDSFDHDSRFGRSNN